MTVSVDDEASPTVVKGNTQRPETRKPFLGAVASSSALQPDAQRLTWLPSPPRMSGCCFAGLFHGRRGPELWGMLGDLEMGDRWDK